ncbi:MAG TPA: hypothetical protein VHZ53_20750, partial [Steroidobacteraceae bacterium]|nr:hypothetical protein [Steroidobacteraceae bacterium]
MAADPSLAAGAAPGHTAAPGHAVAPGYAEARSYAVDPEAVQAFRRDGAVCLRGLFSASELEAVAAGIERNIREPSANAKVASRPDDPGFFFQDYCNWQRIPEYRELIFGSSAAAA